MKQICKQDDSLHGSAAMSVLYACVCQQLEGAVRFERLVLRDRAVAVTGAQGTVKGANAAL